MLPGVGRERSAPLVLADESIGKEATKAADLQERRVCVATAVPPPWEAGEELRNTFRRMLAGLTLAKGGGLCISLCSTVSGEGTSWIAAGLACAFAETCESVWVVDAHRTRASQKVMFAAERNGSIAVTESSPKPWLQRIAIALPRQGSDFSADLRELIAAARRPGRIVIVDLEPLRESTHALGLSDAVDGVLLVAEAERERREVLKRSVATLERAGHRVLGAVLNKRVRHVPGIVYRWL